MPLEPIAASSVCVHVCLSGRRPYDKWKLLERAVVSCGSVGGSVCPSGLDFGVLSVGMRLSGRREPVEGNGRQLPRVASSEPEEFA